MGHKKALGICLILVCVGVSAEAGAATDEERIRQLEQTVGELKAMLQQLTGMSPEQMRSMQQSVQTMQQQVEQANQAAEAAVQAVEKSEAETQARADKVHIGGYGELHYNNLDADDSDEDLHEVDFHRFVLYFGYDFSDRLRFASELEIEHALVESGEEGEVELEQAYLQYDITERQNLLGGAFLVPVGLLNETHEPPTFYGVERNDVENVIIPTTWTEAGAMYGYNFPFGLGVDLALHSGLAIESDGDDAFRIREGRQHVSEASAEDLATTVRLRYTGIPGVNIGGAFQYQADPSQEGGDGLDAGYLYEGHVDLGKGPFSFRALYANFSFDGDAVEAADADDQWGYYLEPSFKILPNVGIYARYEDLEGGRLQDRFDQWETGVNFWPHPDVVLKFDVRTRDHSESSEEGRDFDGFDIGLGYQFN
jgi:hypothetical protein